MRINKFTTEGTKCERDEGREQSLEETLHLEEEEASDKGRHSCYHCRAIGGAPLGQALHTPVALSGPRPHPSYLHCKAWCLACRRLLKVFSNEIGKN